VKDLTCTQLLDYPEKACQDQTFSMTTLGITTLCNTIVNAKLNVSVTIQPTVQDVVVLIVVSPERSSLLWPTVREEEEKKFLKIDARIKKSLEESAISCKT
jgi:hypothetical protein